MWCSRARPRRPRRSGSWTPRRTAARAPPGDRRAARLVAEAFRQSGFTVEVDRFERDEKQLVNVVGRRAGETGRQIVVVADRDASGVPDAAGSASDTAALLQLARVFEGRPSEKTLVLASVDGSALGQVGATRLMRSLPDPDQVDGHRDRVRAGLRRQRPARGDRLVHRHRPRQPAPAAHGGGVGARGDRARWPRPPAPLGQVGRLSFPLGIGAQGVLLGGGYDAVRIAGGGEREDTSGTAGDAIDRDRLGTLGRVMLRTVNALDGATRDAGPAQRLRDGGRPGHARLGAGGAGADADPARAGGQRGRVRARAPAAQPGDAVAGVAGGRRRSRSCWASASRTCWTWSARWTRPRRRWRPTWCRWTPGRWRVMAGVVIVVVGAWIGLRRAVGGGRPRPGRAVGARARRWCCRWP